MLRFSVRALVSAVVLASLGGCSSADDGDERGTRTPHATALAAVAEDVSAFEGELRATVEAALEAYLRGDALEFYSHAAHDYREKCPVDDFLGVVLLGQTSVGNWSDTGSSLEQVWFEDSRGFVDVPLMIANVDVWGDPAVEAYPEYWIREGGEWKFTTDDPAPCGEGGFAD